MQFKYKYFIPVTLYTRSLISDFQSKILRVKDRFEKKIRIIFSKEECTSVILPTFCCVIRQVFNLLGSTHKETHHKRFHVTFTIRSLLHPRVISTKSRHCLESALRVITKVPAI